MSLSFERKGQIFDYLGNPERWESVFDADFYDDPKRKLTSKNIDDIQLSYPRDNRESDHLVVKHTPTDAFLEIRKTGDNLTIIDERGVESSSNAPFVEIRPDWLPRPANTNSASGIVKIEHLGISISFSSDGSKDITFENSNHYITLNGPTDKQKEALRNGRLLHRIIIDNESLENLTGTARNSLTLLQLVVARDLSIQPDLKAFNGLAIADEAGYTQLRRLSEEIRSQSGSRRYRDLFFGAHEGRYAMMERAWDDTTEFVGNTSEIPSKFSLQKVKDAFHLFTSLDGREKIFSFTRIFEKASKDLPDSISLSEIQPNNFVKSMLKGEKVTDQRHEKWKYIVVKNGGDFGIINNMRDEIKKQLRLDSDEVAFINFHPELSIVAIRTDTLEKIKDREPYHDPEPEKPKHRSGIINPALVV